MAAARTRISCKQVRNLTGSELEQCQALTMGGRGVMQEVLLWAHKERDCQDTAGRPAQALLVRELQTGRIVAWCLVGCEENIAYFYVDKRHRRRGLGRRLMRKLTALRPDVSVCPWNGPSRSFFAAVAPGVAVAPGY